MLKNTNQTDTETLKNVPKSQNKKTSTQLHDEESRQMKRILHSPYLLSSGFDFTRLSKYAKK